MSKKESTCGTISINPTKVGTEILSLKVPKIKGWYKELIYVKFIDFMEKEYKSLGIEIERNDIIKAMDKLKFIRCDDVWRCFGCGAECERSHERTDVRCSFKEIDDERKILKTDWRKVQ